MQGLILFLRLWLVIAWRSSKSRNDAPGRPEAEAAAEAVDAASLVESFTGEEVFTEGVSKVLCTRRLPYFRNRLCMEVKTHTDDLINFISGTDDDAEDGLGASSNPIALPDVTLDLAWMGCSTCTPAMRVCSAGQTCRKDPKSSLSFPWSRVMALSIKSLVAGHCISLSQLLVIPAVSSAFLPFLEQYTGALAPYLGSVIGYASARLMDELLLGRYCIYLTTHVAGEVISGKTLTQDMRCIDHLYTIHIPGLFGLLKSREVSNPESSLVCWPTAEAMTAAGKVLDSMEAIESDEDEEDADDLEVPELPSPALLAKEKVCRAGSNLGMLGCNACQTVAQAATWRMKRLRDAAQTRLMDAEDELKAVESKMLIHPNTKEQCRGDDDPKCLDDYSLCVLKPGLEATTCEANNVYWPEKEKQVCSNWCTSTCGNSFYGKHPYCYVSEEHVGQSCRINRAAPLRFGTVKKDQFGRAWVHCGMGPVAMYNINWQHRLLKIVAMRKAENASVEDREHAGRQVMQILAEPTLSLANVTMMDTMVLRLAQLVGEVSFKSASDSVCHEAACCSE